MHKKDGKERTKGQNAGLEEKARTWWQCKVHQDH